MSPAPLWFVWLLYGALFAGGVAMALRAEQFARFNARLAARSRFFQKFWEWEYGKAPSGLSPHSKYWIGYNRVAGTILAILALAELINFYRHR